MKSKRLWWVCLLSFLLLPIGLVQGQTPIQIVKNEAWLDFPQSVDFHLAATAVSPITAIQLEYGIDMLHCGEVTAVTSPSFTESIDLDLTWRWDLLQETFIPPGSTLWWRWHLTTADGQTMTTDTETAVFLDSWFVWQSLTEENVIVHWYRGPNSLGQQVMTAALESVDQLAAETGLRLTEPVHLYLYDESFDLQASLPGAPAWAGGAAFPEHNVVLITANPRYLDYALDTTRHEIGHLVIGRLTFNCTNGLPTWLNEGLAMVAEGHEDEQAAARLDEAIAENRVLTIPQLEGSFSVHADQARLSYAQSYSLVRYLLDTYGQPAMLTLLETFRDGATPDEALMTTYGFDSNGLEDEWRAAVGAQVRPRSEGAAAPTAVATLSLSAPTAETTAINQPTATNQPTASATVPVSATVAATQMAAVPVTPTRIPLAPTADPPAVSPPYLFWGTAVGLLVIAAAILLISLKKRGV